MNPIFLLILVVLIACALAYLIGHTHGLSHGAKTTTPVVIVGGGAGTGGTGPGSGSQPTNGNPEIKSDAS